MMQKSKCYVMAFYIQLLSFMWIVLCFILITNNVLSWTAGYRGFDSGSQIHWTECFFCAKYVTMRHNHAGFLEIKWVVTHSIIDTSLKSVPASKSRVRSPHSRELGTSDLEGWSVLSSTRIHTLMDKWEFSGPIKSRTKVVYSRDCLLYFRLKKG